MIDMTYVNGVVVAMVDVTTVTDRKLEQKAVAEARFAMSVGLVPVGLKHLPKLSLQAARANNLAPWCNGSSVDAMRPLATGLDSAPRASESSAKERRIEAISKC